MKFLRATLQLLSERFPLTMQGVIVLLIALVALRVFGYGRMDLVVFALAVCALAIVCFSTVIVLLGGLILRHQIQHQLEMQQLLKRHTPRIKVEAGYPNETGFTLPTMPWLPLIGVSWEIVYPDAIHNRNKLSADEQYWEEEIVPQRRCKSTSITRRYTVRDVLGFSRFSWRFTQEGELLALPQSGNIKVLPLLRSLTAEDGIPDPGGNPEGDRMEIRPYVPGDSVRNIMWKVYARNRHLNVRLAERSVFHSNRTLAYLLSSPEDEAAAAVARVAVESGALGDDWLFSADGSDEPTNNIEQALELIAQSRALDGPHGYGLNNFLQQFGTQGSVHCIVFAGAEMAPWLQELRVSIARFRVRFSVVLATDGFVTEQQGSRWQRLLFSNTRTQTEDGDIARNGTARGEMSRLLTELGQLVESTLVVDRRTGYSFEGNSFDKRMTRNA
ncbi:MAG: DUF58 domain-containing protein [Gammaproteobacteria bacterium]|nr:DUF58 domain-containing protein [Gammaproteobacteria bacterium]MDP2141850.1 DUF58 domain-containing protein [Gammaproteobacteria bacterium]MDP2348341.1 DUF58 domain-containing protein [Gammaproteobacteria bacterium]